MKLNEATGQKCSLTASSPSVGLHFSNNSNDSHGNNSKAVAATEVVAIGLLGLLVNGGL